MKNTPLTVPAPDDIREQIRARVAELRALRRMLRLSEATAAAEAARARQHPLAGLPQQEAAHVN